jgi:hypothetical protein
MACRAFLLVAILVCAGCGAKPFQLPESAGDWRLAGQTHAQADQWTAVYQGQPEMRLELRRMSSGTMAFSAVQSWRAEAGKLAFYRGRYFGIASSPGADHATLNRFVAAVEKGIPE